MEFITDDKCTGCGTCVSICPKHLLTFEDGYPTFKEGKDELCMRCGHCTAYCPEKSCHLSEFSESLSPVHSPVKDQEAIRNLLESRRSYRLFARLPVDQKTLDKILELTAYYPSGKNIRPIRFIILNGKQKVKSLSDSIVDWMRREGVNNPKVGDEKTVKALAESYAAGNDFIFRNATGVVFMAAPKDAVWGTVDATIAATYFNLAAESLDIGCTYAGYAVRMIHESKELQELVGLSSEEMIPIGLFFGRKTIHAGRAPGRDPIPVTYL